MQSLPLVLNALSLCSYLLSPQSAVLGGPGLPGVRYSLLGSPSALQHPPAARDMDAVFLTEIVEFATSCVPAVKGQEAYIGLPHLQAYRVIRAMELSDIGLHAKAQKWVSCFITGRQATC